MSEHAGQIEEVFKPFCTVPVSLGYDATVNGHTARAHYPTEALLEAYLEAIR